MKILLFLLLISGCNSIKDLEIEDDYPVSREYKLAKSQGKWNSIEAEVSIFGKDKKSEEIKKQKNTAENNNIFMITLDYLTQKYPIKNIDSSEGIIITEEFLDNKNKKIQITAFAKDISTFKVNIANNIELAKQIKNEIENEYAKSSLK